MAENDAKILGSRKNYKYFLYIAIVLIATALSLFFALNGQFNEVVESLRTADWRFLLLILGLVFLSYCVDGLIILIFCRLYTRTPGSINNTKGSPLTWSGSYIPTSPPVHLAGK